MGISKLNILKLSWHGLFYVGRFIIPWLCAQGFCGARFGPLSPQMSPDGTCFSCRSTLSLSDLWVLWRCSQDKRDDPSRHWVLQAQMCKHDNPKGNLSPVGRSGVINAIHLGHILHSTYGWPAGLSPERTIEFAALNFCSILCTLPLLFLGILSQNKHLWEMPCLKVCIPLKIWAKTHETCVCPRAKMKKRFQTAFKIH